MYKNEKQFGKGYVFKGQLGEVIIGQYHDAETDFTHYRIFLPGRVDWLTFEKFIRGERINAEKK